MYFTDTTAGVVLAWDYDSGAGTLANERVLYRHAGPGSPDGFRVDTHGFLWHAVYGEGRVLKIDPRPAGGAVVVGEVTLPTRNATCVEFADDGWLYVTTAADEEGEGESKALGGAVFRVQVGAEGSARYAFKLGE